MRFADVIAPEDPASFLRSTFGREPRYFASQNPRFRSLLTWDTLTDVITRYRLTFPRIRLAKHGSRIVPDSFMYSVPGARGIMIPRVNMRALQDAIANGAMLIIDAIDEIVPEIESLAHDMERVCGEHAWANAYIGWNETQGFATHWDDHDTIILQVRGRKAWRVYEPTLLHPLRGMESSSASANEPQPRPDQALKIALNITLQEGDALHIPRGWWHDATPFAEPSVHLTMGITCRTGIDVVEFLKLRLYENVLFRKNIPRLATPAEQASYLKDLGCALQAEWSTVIFDDLISHANTVARARLAPSLPWAVAGESSGQGRTLTWLPARCLVRLTDDGLVVMTANVHGKYDRSAEPIVDALSRQSPITFDTLLAAVSDGGFDEAFVTRIIKELARDGLVRVSSESETATAV